MLESKIVRVLAKAAFGEVERGEQLATSLLAPNLLEPRLGTHRDDCIRGVLRRVRFASRPPALAAWATRCI